MHCDEVKKLLHIENECCIICHEWDVEFEQTGFYFITIEGAKYSICCKIADECDRQGIKVYWKWEVPYTRL